MCTCRVATSMANSTYRRLREDRVHGEEIAGQQALSLDAQERPPGGVQVARSGPVAPGPRDPADGRLAHVMTETGQLAVHPAVSPGGVLPGQPQRQVADLCAGPWPSWPSGIGPFAGEETAVPGQQGSPRGQSANTPPRW